MSRIEELENAAPNFFHSATLACCFAFSLGVAPVVAEWLWFCLLMQLKKYYFILKSRSFRALDLCLTMSFK